MASGKPERTWTAPSPHHGVAVPLDGGGMLVSVGTAEARTGAQVVDAAGNVTDRNASCPGVHDEDGFTKIDSPDAYGRIGNQSGSPESAVVLGD